MLIAAHYALEKCIIKRNREYNLQPVRIWAPYRLIDVAKNPQGHATQVFKVLI